MEPIFPLLLFPNTNTNFLFYTSFLGEASRLTVGLCIISREGEIHKKHNYNKEQIITTKPLTHMTKWPYDDHNKETASETTTALATKSHPAHQNNHQEKRGL